MNTDTPIDDVSACLSTCLAALQYTQECANASIRSGDRTLEGCALICLDCAAICQATISVLARGSEHHGDFCALCEHVCRACAEECEKHQHVHCRRCAAACRECERACAVHASERHSLPGGH